MSWWSITAISPGLSRLVRFLVRASTRTTPRTPGVSGSRARWRVKFRGILAILPWGKGYAARPTRARRGATGAQGAGPRALGADRRVAAGGGLVDELTGVVEGGAGVDAGHHAGQLTQPFVALQPVHPAGGDVP